MIPGHTMNGANAMRLLYVALAAFVSTLAAVPWSAVTPPTASAAPVLPPVRWGYHVNFASDSGLTSLRQHIGKLTHLAPRWYTLDAVGELAPTPDPNRAAISALARANGVKLVPYVRNTAKWHDLTPFLDSPAARARAVAAIVAAVTSENFDGIHIDFEEVSPADRDKLTVFIGELAAAMRQRGKLMSQAMGPKLADAATGWGASWDYAALGKLNDLVVIMAYTAPTNKPHPIAAAPWVEQNIAYALGKIPAEKVVLGLPWYGYDWNATKGDAGVALTGPQALTLAAAHGVTPQWHGPEQEYSFLYETNGEQHRVWYSDRRSHEVRLALAAANGLAGAAFWRVGQEEPGVWASLAAGAPAPAATVTPLPPPTTPTSKPSPPAPTSTAVPLPTATATATPRPASTATATVSATASPTATPPDVALRMALPPDVGAGVGGNAGELSALAVPPSSPATEAGVPDATPKPDAATDGGNKPPGAWPVIIVLSLSFVAIGGGAGLRRLRRGRPPYEGV